MIKNFSLNKEMDIAIVELGGEGFHRDLHRLCKVVSQDHRRFDGKRWFVEHASLYAIEFRNWWPEFSHWVWDFEQQLELFNGEEEAQEASAPRTATRA